MRELFYSLLFVVVATTNSFALPGVIEANKTSLFEPPLCQNVTVTDSPTVMVVHMLSITCDEQDTISVVVTLVDTVHGGFPLVFNVATDITTSVDIDSFIVPSGWKDSTTYSVKLTMQSRKHAQSVTGNVVYVTTGKYIPGGYTGIDPVDATTNQTNDQPVLYRVFNYAGQDMTNGQAITHQEAKNRFSQKMLILAPLDPKTSTIRPGSGHSEQL